MNLAATLGLNTAAFTSGLGSAGGALGAFRGMLGGLLGPVAAITGGLASVAGAAAFLKSSIGAAANMENLEGSFTTLLGGAAAAKTRMKDLADFAASTPFELNGIAQASKLLQAFTGNALSTGDGLRLVGDAAAAVGQPLEAVSMWFGRLYAGLKDGQPLGEPIQNLTQLGLISGDARKQLLALQGQSLDNARVMEVLNQAFGSNSGAMARLAATYDGKVSTMKDGWTELQVALGTPIKDALKPFIDSATAALKEWLPAAKAVGEQLAAGLTVFRQAWEGGDLMGLIGDVLSLAFGKAVNFFMQGLNGIATGLGTLFDTLPTYLAAAFQVYTSADYWLSIGQLVLGAFQSIGGELLNLFMKPITAMQAGVDTIVQNLAEGLGKIPGIGKKLGLDDFKAQSFSQNLADREKNGFFLKDAANESANAGARNIVEAGTKLAEITKEARGAAVDVAKGFVDGFQKGFANGGGVLQEFTSSAEARLAERLRKAREANTEGQKTKELPGGGPASAAATTAKTGEIYADRLAKIGGFIGGAGGPAVEFARRTATATERLVTDIRQLPSQIARALPTGAGGAVWS